jgi:hypothetical protein
VDRLRSIGVGGRMYTWVRYFLRGRRARVVLKGVFSSWKQYLSGVPQGSLLSPLLFNIFVTPMLRRVSTDRIVYADDVGLMSSGANLTATSNQLSRALIKVESWETRYKASFRLDECYVVLFTQRQSSADPVVVFKGHPLGGCLDCFHAGLTVSCWIDFFHAGLTVSMLD